MKKKKINTFVLPNVNYLKNNMYVLNAVNNRRRRFLYGKKYIYQYYVNSAQAGVSSAPMRYFIIYKIVNQFFLHLLHFYL